MEPRTIQSPEGRRSNRPWEHLAHEKVHEVQLRAPRRQRDWIEGVVQPILADRHQLDVVADQLPGERLEEPKRKQSHDGGTVRDGNEDNGMALATGEEGCTGRSGK